VSPRNRARDLYAILGVARDADTAAIKRAYKRLAREWHPDAKPGDPHAEERFKEIGRAHKVLSDPERRRAYDEFGDLVLDPNFDAEKARQARGAFGGFRGGTEFSFEDDLGDLFDDFFEGRRRGRRGRRRPRRGTDTETELDLEFLEAATGGERKVRVTRPTADGGQRTETLTIRIPPGVADGGRIRLSGKGAESASGGPSGDLYVRVRVRPHPVFRREGRDLHLEAPVSVREAVLGSSIEIPTLTGRVTLQVPPGTDSGARLRLRGKGIPAHGSRRAGDLIVAIRIRVPKQLDAETRRVFEELAEADPTSLRRHLFE
jgi:curved DNA-binding protein